MLAERPRLHLSASSSNWRMYGLAPCSSAPVSESDRSAWIPSLSADFRPDRSRRSEELAESHAALTTGNSAPVSCPSMRIVVAVSPTSVLTRMANPRFLSRRVRTLQVHPAKEQGPCPNSRRRSSALYLIRGLRPLAWEASQAMDRRAMTEVRDLAHIRTQRCEISPTGVYDGGPAPAACETGVTGYGEAISSSSTRRMARSCSESRRTRRALTRRPTGFRRRTVCRMRPGRGCDHSERPPT